MTITSESFDDQDKSVKSKKKILSMTAYCETDGWRTLGRCQRGKQRLEFANRACIVILNPLYRKVRSCAMQRDILQHIGVIAHFQMDRRRGEDGSRPVCRREVPSARGNTLFYYTFQALRSLKMSKVVRGSIPYATGCKS